LKLKDIRKHFWSFGLSVGFISAFILTFIITLWEWLENPAGIFHNDNGTNWFFVYETAKSWFVPTFINVTVFSAVAHLLLSLIKRLKNYFS
jgi:hypothetical protein